MIDFLDHVGADERVETLTAHLDRGVAIIEALIAQLDEIGGYCTPLQQAERRAARAYVAEVRK